ncbi:hypothetical protein NQ035_01160 [Staphylococcus gallinarum]|uniref:hypothetical protein n=1 Tax=Staphylococcus gallinarum TaxID=1293 RepID=UPI000D1DB0A1|nr:hypothetical protein [Staphylococcus gallinarum]MCD8819972.1 hypothetical protein [Staphylococcus gallinarum]MCQ9287465.1 hypothetical protein [Staphylococcus gallinarum]PTL06592.1 hypothetical protein BUZ09_11245 [Staphylococcus gallinarum]PTL10298.1 hypothetical protein BUZ15_06055 [Staphylococcus gallinarum]RIL34456.1 hypothetical protein BUY98_04040 [Staphylococcus gallinarum]
MGIILIIGLLLPMIYVMQLTKNKQQITWKKTGVAIILAVIGNLIVTLIYQLIQQSGVNIWLALGSSVIVAIVWALLLCGSYAAYQILSNSINK